AVPELPGIDRGVLEAKPSSRVPASDRMKWLRDGRQCELLLSDDRLRASTRLLDGFRAIRADQRDNMYSFLANPCKFSLPIRLALVGVLTLLSSGWTC